MNLVYIYFVFEHTINGLKTCARAILADIPLILGRHDGAYRCMYFVSVQLAAAVVASIVVLMRIWSMSRLLLCNDIGVCRLYAQKQECLHYVRDEFM
jgi:hypothetical protein